MDITLHNQVIKHRYEELYYIATHYYNHDRYNILILSAKRILIQSSNNWLDVYMKYILLDRLYYYIISTDDKAMRSLSLHISIKWFKDLERSRTINLLMTNEQPIDNVEDSILTNPILYGSCALVFCYSSTF